MSAGARVRSLGVICLTIGCAAFSAPASAQTAATPDQAALIEKGAYVAVAADCKACHTNPKGGKAFAGGYGIASPLGTIVSTNITPSKTAGIGNYTEAQFARAVRTGVRADGANLYPAMPYTSYARMTDDDLHALYVYFVQGVQPVDEEAPKTNLPFPFNVRLSLLAWNLLFRDKATPYVADKSKSEQSNRGAYLTDVLEHCSACHTPRNLLMAEVRSKAYAGAPLGPWHAPNITSDPVSGIGGWSDQELVQYLKTGHAAGKDQAAGGMGEAVENSLQYLRGDDLQAIVVYLKSIPAIRNPANTKPAYSYGEPARFEATLRGAAGPHERDTVKSGEALYSGYCASCHQPTGAGSDQQDYPSLFHNAAVGSHTGANVIAAILFGVDRTAEKQVLMPRFDSQSYVEPLSDEQIALIANYVLKQFGDPAVQVTAADVAVARQGGPSSPLALISTYWPAALALIGMILVAMIFTFRRRARMRAAGRHYS